jgi:hypothetical protein
MALKVSLIYSKKDSTLRTLAEAGYGWIAAGSKFNTDVKVLSTTIESIVPHGLLHLAHVEEGTSNTHFETIVGAQWVFPSKFYQ